MPPLPSPFRALVRLVSVAAALVAVTAHAQSLLPPDRPALDAFTEFAAPASNWQLAGGLAGDPRRDKTLTATPGVGLLVCNPGTTPAARGHLVTAWEHGDLELDLEFLLTPGSNSGVYLQGRYEIQLFDSWGVTAPTPADCGGLYHRWEAARGAGRESFDGVAPRANAARAPGLWQKLHIEFQAPRFDAAGQKTQNARFVKVVLNGYTIHENVEATGPTRSALANDEKPLGPLMIQGDHGSVALRRIAYKRYEANARLAVADLAYRLHSGAGGKLSDYDTKTPAASGPLARFSQAAVEKSGRFVLTISGNVTVPRAGDYAFTAETNDPVRFQVDGRTAITPLERGSQPGVVTLSAGVHAFRLDLQHNSNARPSLELLAEGPGIAPHALTTRDSRPGGNAAAAPRQLRLEPADGRVRVQRGFVPFEPRKRLYALNVGTPSGQHFSYDLETGAVLRVWRGPWLDTFEMWESRGESQLAKPTGPALTLSGKPTVAFIENGKSGGWPEGADAMQSSQGYVLEADGLPVFLSKISDLSIRDRVAPSAEGRSLERRLEFKGSLPSWEVQVLLAEGATITPQPGGKGWIVGDRDYYIDWPAGAALQPAVRTVGDTQYLVVRLARSALEAPLSYSLVW